MQVIKRIRVDSVSFRKYMQLVYLNKKKKSLKMKTDEGWMPKSNTNKALKVKVIYKASSLHLHCIVKRCTDG